MEAGSFSKGLICNPPEQLMRECAPSIKMSPWLKASVPSGSLRPWRPDEQLGAGCWGGRVAGVAESAHPCTPLTSLEQGRSSSPAGLSWERGRLLQDMEGVPWVSFQPLGQGERALQSTALHPQVVKGRPSSRAFQVGHRCL